MAIKLALNLLKDPMKAKTKAIISLTKRFSIAYAARRKFHCFKKIKDVYSNTITNNVGLKIQNIFFYVSGRKIKLAYIGVERSGREMYISEIKLTEPCFAVRSLVAELLIVYLH